MAQPKIIADFETQLSTAIAVAGTSFSLVSATDDDGVALPAGFYYFTIDNGTSAKEYLAGDLSGTSVTNVVSVSRQGVETSGAARAHRVGASVLLTDFATYKKYIDEASVAGASDASSTVKGIVEIPTYTEIDSDTAAGGTGAKLAISPDQLALSKYGLRLPASGEKDALAGVGGTPSSTNKYITQAGEFALHDQTQTTQDSTAAVGEANSTTKKNKLAQSFVPTVAKISGVKLYKSADTGTFTGTVTISLQADSAGAPSGSALATVTITNAQWLLIAAGEFAVPFSSEYASMTVGGTYWIVVATSTSDTSNHPNLGITTSNLYASGSAKYNNTTDGWVSNTGDLYFKTIGGKNSQVAASDTSGIVPVDILPTGLIAYDNTTASTSQDAPQLMYKLVLPAGTFRANSGIRVRVVGSSVTSTSDSMSATAYLNGTSIGGVSHGASASQSHEIDVTVLCGANTSAQVIFSKSSVAGVVSPGVSTASIDLSGVVVLEVYYDRNDSSATGSYAGTLVERIGK